MRVLCKDCWTAHELAELLGGCKSCHEKTGIDRPERLDTKAKSISLQEKKPIVCKLHPDEPLDVYCATKQCNKEVSPRALIGEQSVIALVGDKRSGKTSLLWVLSERLRQANNSGVFIRQALGDSDQQMRDAVSSILQSGSISETQPTDANVRNFAWEVNTAPGASTVIAFHDAAGELWNNLSALSRAAYERFYRYLRLAGSFIFTIDGERLIEYVETTKLGGVSTQHARDAQVHEITIIDTLGRRVGAREGDSKYPIAAVVTKTDKLWDNESWKLFKPGSGATPDDIDTAVRALLTAAGRQPLIAALEDAFSPVRFFAVSAFGGEQLHPLRIEALRPARVEEPLLALLRPEART